MLQLKGGDTSKFDKEVGATFKKSAKGSRAPGTEKEAIDRIMLVCQCENGVDVAYGDPDGFGHPGMMGLWDLFVTITSLTPLPSREKMACPCARCGLRWAKRKGGPFGNLHKCISCRKFVSGNLGTWVPRVPVNSQPIPFLAPL